MDQTKLTPSGKPFDIHERLLLFACDIVRLTQFLHTRGSIGHDDFIAKNRIALKEAKERGSDYAFANALDCYPRSSIRWFKNQTNW